MMNQEKASFKTRNFVCMNWSWGCDSYLFAFNSEDKKLQNIDELGPENSQMEL
jgi:hypothetical protein